MTDQAWIKAQLKFIDSMKHEPKSLAPYEDCASIIADARKRFAAFPAAVAACKQREFMNPDAARVALAICLQAIVVEPTELTPPVVAKRFGVKPATVINWIRSGRLLAVNVARPGKRPRYRISEAALADLGKQAKRPEAVPKLALTTRYKRY